MYKWFYLVGFNTNMKKWTTLLYYDLIVEYKKVCLQYIDNAPLSTEKLRLNSGNHWLNEIDYNEIKQSRRSFLLSMF